MTHNVQTSQEEHPSTRRHDPRLGLDTRLVDLNGGRNLGATGGTIQIQFGAGPSATIDLTHAQTIDDVVDALNAGIAQYETDHGVSILGPGGVSISGETRLLRWVTVSSSRMLS